VNDIKATASARAERAGNISAQVACYRERARAWRRYAALLEAAGRDGSGAVMAAQRDENRARELERGATEER
jgi:hypothetical protein